LRRAGQYINTGSARGRPSLPLSRTSADRKQPMGKKHDKTVFLA